MTVPTFQDLAAGFAAAPGDPRLQEMARLVARPPVTLKEARARYRATADAALQDWLASGERLSFSAGSAPRVSVVIPLYNQAELTHIALRSLKAGTAAPFELIVVDNASTDRTGGMLDRIDGATVIRNAKNVGYLEACNEGAARAEGAHILLLNSDVCVLPGAVDALTARLDAEPGTGVAGGRLVYPDGRLQEAGSLLWRSGWPHPYGRNRSPDNAEYLFSRHVDFVSAAFILFRRSSFESLGGFDPVFKPAYFEEIDFAMRLQEAGEAVVYDPASAVVHMEFGSASALAGHRQMFRNKRKFAARHRARLVDHLPRRKNLLTRARHARRGAPAILLLWSGAEDRWAALLKTAREQLDPGQGAPHVTAVLLPGTSPDRSRAADVEVLRPGSRADFLALLRGRVAATDLVVCEDDALRGWLEGAGRLQCPVAVAGS